MVGYTRVAGFACVLLCLLTLGGCEQRRRPDRFLIPAGYFGWVEVEHGVTNAPLLPIEDRCFLIKIPQSGRVQTSTPMAYGWAKDEYYYEAEGQRQLLPSTGSGGGRRIWAGEIGGKGGRGSLMFFVGTEAQWKRNPTRRTGNLNKSGK
jgi:hypothetical protein